MKKKTWGIILLIIGVLSVFGSVSNGSFAEYAYGIGIAEMTTIAIQIGCIAGGIVLINKK